MQIKIAIKERWYLLLCCWFVLEFKEEEFEVKVKEDEDEDEDEAKVCWIIWNKNEEAQINTIITYVYEKYKDW